MKKTRWLLTILLALLSLVSLAACADSSSNTKGKHQHVWGEWEVVNNPTLRSTGEMVRTCTENSNHADTFVLPKLNDTDYTVSYDPAPTCENDGTGIFVYEKDNQTFSFTTTVPILAHDYSKSVTCSLCNVRHPECVEIHSIEDMQIVKTKPDGVYILMNDLSVENLYWNGVGNEHQPFSGIFDGNGHEISNVTLNAGKSVGLFAYNKGTVYNLTVNNVSYTGKFYDWEGNCGAAIVGYNEGTVANCKVTGTLSINWTQTISDEGGSLAGDKTYRNSAYTGALAGYNSGKIENCEVSATISYGLNPTLNVNMNAGIMFTYSTVYLHTTGSFGALVGYNKGEISFCNASGFYSINSLSSASSTSDFHIGDNHHLHLYTTVNAGAAVGINAGRIKNCNVKECIVLMDQNMSSFCYPHLAQNTTPNKLVGVVEPGGSNESSLANP